MPSLYEGFSLPAIEAMSCGVPAGGHHRRGPARGRRRRQRHRPRRAPRRHEALAAKIAIALDDPTLRDRIGAAGRQRVIDRWTWRHTADGTVEQYRALLAETADIQARRPGGARPAPRFRRSRHRRRERADRCSPSTTTRSACAPATCCSTSAAASAATPSRRFRRGARVVACDMALDRAASRCAALFEAMVEAGEASPDGIGAAVNGDATRLPFPDDTFDRIIACEVMEHIPDDLGALDELARVLKPGGTMAVTIPAWLPEKICWALSDEYHAPFVEGGHVRIYTEAELRRRCAAPASSRGAAHHAHALHSPYWWLKCAVGPTNDDIPLVKPTTGSWCGTSTKQPGGHPHHRAAAQPGAGQEPRGLRHQAASQRGARSPSRASPRRR